MRRWVAWVLAAVSLVLGGCSPKTAVPPDTAQLTCRFTATYGDMQVAGELARYGAGTLSVTFSQPETLKDVSVVWNGEEVTLSLYGITASVDPADLPEGALGQGLIAALDGALRGEGTCRMQDGKSVFEGQTDVGNYTLVCNGESGLPESLCIPELPLEATFLYE